jgi:hypothetical protein
MAVLAQDARADRARRIFPAESTVAGGAPLGLFMYADARPLTRVPKHAEQLSEAPEVMHKLVELWF